MDNGASSYRRFLGGDDQSIVEIIKDYKDGLMLYLNGFVQNIHVAEELTEDTVVKLVVKRPRFSGKSTFKTWLYTIGRNVAMDSLRKAAKLPTVSMDALSLYASEEENVERNYIRTEQKIQLHQALKKLNTDYRSVLYLTYFEEFNHAQVAAVMKKSKKQVENLVYRAKLSLKSELEKEGFVYEEL